MKVALGASLVLLAIVGCAVLFVATANARGLAAYAGVYWPGPIVVLILVMFAIIMLEAGLDMLRRADAGGTENPTQRSRLANIVFSSLFVFPLLGILLAGIVWMAQRIGAGLEPTTESYVVAGASLLYIAIRGGLIVSRASPREVGRLFGIEPGGPDWGESGLRFGLRMLIGIAIGLPLLDAVLVFLGAALAPNDSRIYPFISSTTVLAAGLWIIGLGTLSSGISTLLRRRRTTLLRSVVIGAVAVATLVPAVVLDARVPLYPLGGMIAGEFAGSAPRTATGTAPAAARTDTPSPTAAPGSGTLRGLVLWGTTPVRFARLAVLSSRGVVVAVPVTDIDGRFDLSVPPETYRVTLDAANTPGGFFSTSSPVAEIVVRPNAAATYPTITLTKSIETRQPLPNVVIRPPVTFSWIALPTATSYELRVRDDSAATPSTGGVSPIVVAERTTGTSLTVTTLQVGRRYRWSVVAFMSASGSEIQIGNSITRLFSTQ